MVSFSLHVCVCVCVCLYVFMRLYLLSLTFNESETHKENPSPRPETLMSDAIFKRTPGKWQEMTTGKDGVKGGFLHSLSHHSPKPTIRPAQRSTGH